MPSLRVLGGLCPQRVRSRLDRFIPACAGRATRYSTDVQFVPVHPRRFIPACAGKGVIVDARGTALDGSSRVCGEGGRDIEGGGAEQRFIPACAGKGKQVGEVVAGVEFHPRVCGEGAALKLQRFSGCRFIPACAGKGNASMIAMTTTGGSSPRVRGTLTPPGGTTSGSSLRVLGERQAVRRLCLRMRADKGSEGAHVAVRHFRHRSAVCGR